MRKLLFLFVVLLSYVEVNAQYVLIDEDFGGSSTFASSEPVSVTNYDLDPAASYLSYEEVVINYYGQDATSEGKYDGASGGNLFLLGNNWNQANAVLTWANMDVSAYSKLDDILFGCAFAGGPNGAWTGNWLFALEYSFDDVVADPGNASWQTIDLISNASGWPDPQVAGAKNWSLVTVAANVNLLGKDLLSLRIRSNGSFDYHFDDLKLMVSTPTSGGERVVIGTEGFGPSGYYVGPANEYTGYTNGGAFSFNDYTVHYQNYGTSFTTSYEGNTNDGMWWITDNEDPEGNPLDEDTLMFSVNTLEYADVQLQFGFTYWGGSPGNMVGVKYNADGTGWKPVLTVSPAYSYPEQGAGNVANETFNLIKYDDLLPRAEELWIKIYQLGAGQVIIDDIALTGVYSVLSTDATLSGISFPEDPDLELEPAFDTEITSYDVTLPFGAKDPPLVEVTPADPAADYLIEDALNVNSDNEADRQTYILVTAADGETTKLYTVTFAVDPVDPNTSIRQHRFDYRLYPVPANERIHIYGRTEPQHIRVMDITGKTVIGDDDISDRKSLFIGELPAG